MRQVFKVLVSISVWILFIYGCALLICATRQGAIGGLTPAETMAGGGIAMASFALAAVVARIRQKLE
jgi:hypothetical protein